MTVFNNPVKIKEWEWIAVLVFCVGFPASQFHVLALPQKNEKIETPFPLELQPPLVDNFQDAIDSYGNPIIYSQPIETPDGRKVITAQGLQFEIPNYASGITEIKKPNDSLLPPVVDPIPSDGFTRAGLEISTQQQEYTLPEWLADFNDPDVGPGVPYTPSSDENTLKVLSWDLVPPRENDPQTSIINFGNTQQNIFPLNSSKKETFLINQDVQTITNQATGTTKTIYTPNTTSTTLTSTTSTTTTPPTTTTTTEVITTSSETPSEAFELPGGNSVTLPSWLQDFDDPELSIAVPFEVPEDNNEYNHTITKNLLPPLEPFDDLKILSVQGLPSSQVQPIITTSTTRAPTSTPPTTPIPTTTKRTFSTFKPFQFKFITNKQPSTSLINFPQKPIFTTTKPQGTLTTTHQPITHNTISARIPQFSLRPSAQPTGFKVNSFMIRQPGVKPTMQTLIRTKSNPFFNSKINENGFAFPLESTPTSSESAFHSGSVTTPSWPEGIHPGPGVPFSLPHNKQPEQSFNGIMASTNQAEKQTIDGVTIEKSISSELSPLKFIHNSLPSQSTIPTNQNFIFTSTPLPVPSRLFTPPMIADKDDYYNTDGNLLLQTVPINSNNFPEATEPTTKPESKIVFNKSDQGKVISNSVFEATQPSNKAVFDGTQPTSQFTNSVFGLSRPVNGNSVIGGSEISTKTGFDSPTSPPNFPTQSTTIGTILSDKYTGGFKGAPGILGGQSRPGYAIQPDGSIRDPDHIARPPGQLKNPKFSLQSRIEVPRQPQITTPSTGLSRNREYNGSFGGPPGVLIPYDNTSRT